MSSSQTLKIKVLNKTWDIKCPEQEITNLHLAAERLTETLSTNKKNFPNLDELQNFMLAALNITHELIACQKLEEQQREQIANFMQELDKKTSKRRSTQSDSVISVSE